MSDRIITTLDPDFSWVTLIPGDVVWVRKPTALDEVAYPRRWMIPGFDVELRPNGYPLLIVGADRVKTTTGLTTVYLTLLTPVPQLIQIRKSSTKSA